jgi:hypothetical protein
MLTQRHNFVKNSPFFDKQKREEFFDKVGHSTNMLVFQPVHLLRTKARRVI